MLSIDIVNGNDVLNERIECARMNKTNFKQTRYNETSFVLATKTKEEILEYDNLANKLKCDMCNKYVEKVVELGVEYYHWENQDDCAHYLCLDCIEPMVVKLKGE